MASILETWVHVHEKFYVVIADDLKDASEQSSRNVRAEVRK